jgi:hypothetical protein
LKNEGTHAAYGRDYKSAKAVTKDFEDNKDFIIADVFGGNDGRYVNKEQLVGEETRVTLRYDKLRKLCVVKLTQN